MELCFYSHSAKQFTNATVVKETSQDEYIKNQRAAQKEWQKKKPSKQHLTALMKVTFGNRQKERTLMQAGGDRMVKTMIEEWPCFETEEYVSKIGHKHKRVQYIYTVKVSSNAQRMESALIMYVILCIACSKNMKKYIHTI